jgi:hypothetical protein
MILVETLRLRRWTVWWAAVIAALAVLAIATVPHVHSDLDVNGSRLSGIDIPLVGLVPVAMFLAMIYATSVGLSLNKEGLTLALTWTKPVARPILALRIVAVDVVAVLAAYAFAWIAIVSTVEGCGGTLTSGGADFPATVALSVGVAIMWYALIAAITAALPAGTGAVVGFLWPGALILSSWHVHFNSTVDGAIAAINVFNPMAYMNGSTSTTTSAIVTSYWQLPTDERAAVVWIPACALVALAVGLWTRREA